MHGLMHVLYTFSYERAKCFSLVNHNEISYRTKFEFLRIRLSGMTYFTITLLKSFSTSQRTGRSIDVFREQERIKRYETIPFYLSNHTRIPYNTESTEKVDYMCGGSIVSSKAQASPEKEQKSEKELISK